MIESNLVVIIAIEVAVVLLVLSLFLVMHNKKLRGIVKKLQTRMQELVVQLKEARTESGAPQNETGVSSNYLEFVDEQIALTRNHHEELGSDRDIVLDLSPDSPIPQRAAALRYAILLAEKEAMSAETALDDFDWSKIRSKYEQIFSFYEDYVEPESGELDPEEQESLQKELANAKKRIDNLEKFKKLYFEMEEQWESSKKTAQSHYDELSEMAADASDPEKFETALEGYQAAYGKFNNFLESSDPVVETITVTDPTALEEIKQLKAVAADQHMIINELQTKLAQADTEEVRTELINGLKTELDKQSRFIQESETCIQLMEDELNSANKEMEILRSRLKALPSIKAQLKDATSKRDEYELKVYALTSDKRKLEKRLVEEKKSKSPDTDELRRFKKTIADMEIRYTELEEKYLDLKLQQ